MRAQDAEATEHDDWDLYRVTWPWPAVCAPDDAGRPPSRSHEVWSPYLWRYPLAVRGVGAVPPAAAGRAARRGVQRVGQIEGVLAAQGVCQVGAGGGVPVQVVVDSEVVGVMKPDPAIFASAIEVLGLPPDRVGYVGDSVRNDVRGAEAAGLVALHLDPHDDHPDAPHRRIRSLHDLLDLVAP